MYYILVRFKNKPGKYPLQYRERSYKISSNKFHENDNAGSCIQGKDVGFHVDQILRYEMFVKSIEIVLDD